MVVQQLSPEGEKVCGALRRGNSVPPWSYDGGQDHLVNISLASEVGSKGVSRFLIHAPFKKRAEYSWMHHRRVLGRCFFKKQQFVLGQIDEFDNAKETAVEILYAFVSPAGGSVSVGHLSKQPANDVVGVSMSGTVLDKLLEKSPWQQLAVFGE